MASWQRKRQVVQAPAAARRRRIIRAVQMRKIATATSVLSSSVTSIAMPTMLRKCMIARCQTR